MAMRTAPKPQFLSVTYLSEILKADPELFTESNFPVEYDFRQRGTGREFRGYYKKRGAYAPDTTIYLTNDDQSLFLTADDGTTQLTVEA